MIYVGIDPGKDGGIVARQKGEIIGKHTIPLIGPKKDRNVDFEMLADILKKYSEQNAKFAIEDVHSLYLSSAKANFQFGRIVGIKEGILATLKADLVKVQPKVWQKEMWSGVPIVYKSRTSKDTKATSLLAANKRYPTEDFTPTKRSTKPHDGLVDAALLAEYLEIISEKD